MERLLSTAPDACSLTARVVSSVAGRSEGPNGRTADAVQVAWVVLNVSRDGPLGLFVDGEQTGRLL